METRTTSRRGALGALGVGASLLAGVPAVMAAKAERAPAIDPKWRERVADYRETRARWEASVGVVEDLEFNKALKSLPPEPVPPGSGPLDMNMTLAQLRALSDTPEHKAAWAEYQKAKEAWDAQKAALRETVLGDAERAQEAAWAIFTTALDAMAHYRISSLSDLHQKTVLFMAEFRGTDMDMEYIGALAADMIHLGGEARA